MAATQGESHRRLAVVTGGLGGLGTAICKTLADKGRKVIAVDLGNAPERIAAFDDALAGLDAEFQPLDVTGGQRIQRGLVDADGMVFA